MSKSRKRVSKHDIIREIGVINSKINFLFNLFAQYIDYNEDEEKFREYVNKKDKDNSPVQSDEK
tara:strand:+ start:133 stop:324 length:192 start_codon:yes stop_codon:yes gene_type:complete